VTCSTLAAIVMLGAGLANAGPALDQDAKPAPTTDTSVAPTTPLENKVEWGVDLRLRQVYIPRFLLEAFVDRSGTGAEGTGFGLDVVRRRGNLEIAFGIEFEKVGVDQSSVWINKGDSPNIGNTSDQAAVDYILTPSQGSSLNWFTIEANFINHVPLGTKYLAFRYGAGAGIGIIGGQLLRYHGYCAAGTTTASLDPGCIPQAIESNGGLTLDNTAPNCGGGQPCAKDGIPPVLPVVNIILGLQIRPIDKLVINLEAGIRTLPFIGLSAGYFFF